MIVDRSSSMSYPESFTATVRRCFKRFRVFSGRAGRTEYWSWVLFTWAVGLAFILLGNNVLPVASVVRLILLVPGLAVVSRRLHDVGASAWNFLWCFTIVGIFYVLYLVLKPSEPGPNRFGLPDPLVREG